MNLKEEAASQARAAWKTSWAAVRPECRREAVEFLADMYLRHPEDLEKTVLAVEGGYGSVDPLEQGQPDNLYETLLGDQLEARLSDGWSLAVANHMLSADGARSLRAWAEQERNRRGLESSGHAVAADGGTELGLDDLVSEAAYDLIVELGKLTVAEVITTAKGPEALAIRQARQDKRKSAQRETRGAAARRSGRR